MDFGARVRAKFSVNAIEDYGTSKKVKMGAVYAPDANGEDAGFTKATPWGEIQMTVDNPAAAIQFKVGDILYVDFTLADHRDPMTGMLASAQAAA